MNFFDVFQLSALILFLFIFTGRSVWLHISGIRIFVIGKRNGGFKSLMEIIFILVLFQWIYEIIYQSIDLTFTLLPAILSEVFFNSLIFKILGVVLITSGLVIFIFSLISFGKSWRIGIDTENAGELITTGIFSVTRNPFFIFINFYFTGTVLIYTNLFFSALAVMAVFGIHFHILNEEKFLTKQYGNQYLDYCKKVRRYF
jgi:protein-S-isoprenylcysteine O-methyltransferase Ste14